MSTAVTEPAAAPRRGTLFRRYTLYLSVLVGLAVLSSGGVGAWFAAVFAYWNGHYFVWGTAFALGLGTVLLIPLVVIALASIEEIAQIAFGRAPRRLIGSPSLVPAIPEGPTPKV